MKKTSLALCSLLLTTLACNDDGNDRGQTSSLSDTGSDDPTGDGDGDSGDGDGDSGDGDGDTSGDGDGDTGEPEGMYCVHQCSSTADCLVNGVDVEAACIDNTCTYDNDPCTGKQECVELFSGWQTPCTSGGGECDNANQVCVATDEGGRCATPPGDFIECAALMMEEVEVPDIDGNPVTVCARTGAECNDAGYCYLPCQNDGDCQSPAYPICNVATGTCECGQDADCDTLGFPQYSVCNAGFCGCGSDQNCVDGAAGDVCNAGFCGCTGDMACAGVDNPYDGGMISCI